MGKWAEKRRATVGAMEHARALALFIRRSWRPKVRPAASDARCRGGERHILPGTRTDDTLAAPNQTEPRTAPDALPKAGLPTARVTISESAPVAQSATRDTTRYPPLRRDIARSPR